MRLPIVSAGRLIKFLSRRGYYFFSQKGSHVVMKHPFKKAVTIPNHREIGPGILHRILKDAGVSHEDYCREI
jgi:predicted RNA binding protein YcfA (HicA-like mRNA interferase family)